MQKLLFIYNPHAGKGRVRVVFDEPQRSPAPGQAAVLYDGDTVLGGGEILPSD